MAHQGLERTMELLQEQVYWSTMAADATKWVSECAQCQVAQGNYMTPRPKISHLESNNPMDLLCLDFTKIDPLRTGKENVYVITDAFSKFSVTVLTPNQKALTVAKVLMDKWFHVYGIPAHIHSNQGKSFDNDIIKALCKIIPCLVCSGLCQRNKKLIGLFTFQHSSLLIMQPLIPPLGFNHIN